MKLTSLAAYILFACAIFCCEAAGAETFTVPLDVSSRTGDGGQYLSADFDFHIAFSQIDSITLSFRMPSGYEGTALAGGYFSVFSQLWTVLHGTGTAPTFGSLIGGPETGNPFLGVNLFQVPANSVQQIGFYPPVVFTDPPDNLWPDFLFSGAGSLAVTDYQVATSGVFQGGGFFPDDGQGMTTISWNLPGEFSDARLTIVATPVPEPATVGLACEAVLLSLICSHAARRVPRK